MSDATTSGAAGNVPGPRAAFAGFRDPTTLTKVVTWLLIANAIAEGITGIDNGYAYYLGLDFRSPGETATNFNDTVDSIEGIVSLVIAFCFLRWIHRANWNSRALGAVGMRFTPGWSIGWYFIPIANLWKPFQAMKEIWQTSVNPSAWQGVPTPALLGWWWALWLVSGITIHFSLGGGWSFDSSKSPGFGAISAAIEIALDLVGLLLVRRITAAQLWQSQIADVF